MEVRPGDAGAVAGPHPARTDRRTAGQKVLHPLGGGPIASSAQAVGHVLQVPLEGDARQGALAAEVLRRDVYQQGAVDVFLIPGELAHAVGDHPVLLRGGGHHLSAGADAEGERRPPVGEMAGQLVGGHRQAGVSGVLLVLGGVAVRLPVLNADAHGERLGLHGHAPAVQHLKGVPGGVAGAQNQMAAGENVRALRPGDSNAFQLSAPDVQVRQLALKADVRPQVQQLPAEVFQGDVEIVCAHVGLGVDEDVPGRAAGHQLLQNEAVADVLGAGVQLAVGEGPGAALAELDIGGQVQRSRGPEPLHIGPALFHAPAPLQQDGPQTGPGQHQRGE